MPYKDPEQQTLYWKQYYAKHAAKLKADAARWYLENRQRALEYWKNRRKKFPELFRAYHRRYYQANKEKVAATVALWREKNKQKMKIYLAGYQRSEQGKKMDAERSRAFSKTPKGIARRKRSQAKRRAQTKIEATLTADQWKDILELYKHKCVYCGHGDVKLAQDHYIPLAKGGHHTKENVVPSCKSCNSRKNARHPHKLF